MESLDEEDEPGDVGERGERGHDAVHLVRREDAAERDARPGTRVYLAGISGARGPRRSPEGAVCPARLRPGGGALEPVVASWEGARPALGEQVALRVPGAVPTPPPDLRARRVLGAGESGQGPRARRGLGRHPVQTARPGCEAAAWTRGGRPEEPRVVVEGELREAAPEGGHVRSPRRRGQAVRAGLSGAMPGCGRSRGAALLPAARHRPRATRPPRLGASALTGPCLRAELICHCQLRVVRPLGVVKLALDAVGAFLAWKKQGTEKARVRPGGEAVCPVWSGQCPPDT